MTAAADHDEHLLAEHYTWMHGGDIEAASAAPADLLRGGGLRARPAEPALAFDLGCGP